MFDYCLNVNGFNTKSIKCKLYAAHKAGFRFVELPYEDIIGRERVVEREAKELDLEVVTVFKLHGWFENDGALMGVSDNHISILDECKRRMESARRVGSRWIIALPSYDNRGYFVETNVGKDRFQTLIEVGNKMDILPTLEFMGQTSQVNTVKKCLDFISDIPKATMVVDSFHTWRGGSEIEDILEIPPEKISLLHIADADPAIVKEEYRDMDRVMPGDGIIDNIKFLQCAKSISYRGKVSLGVYKFRESNRNPIDVAMEGKIKMEAIFNEL